MKVSFKLRMLFEIFLSLVHCIVVSSGSSTKWLMSNTTILVKESLSISCTANNVDFMGIVKVEHSTPGKNSSTFSMNGVLKTPYKERGRYMLDYQRDRMRNVSTLHITFKEVHSSDSGMYSCHNLQTPHEEPDQFNLTVLVPIKEAYVALINLEHFDSIRELQGADDLSFNSAFFSSLQPLENGISVEVENGSGLVCFATSDSPDFQIEVSLDQEMIDPKRYHLEMLEHSQVVDEAWKDEGHRLSEDASEHHAWKVVVVKEVGRTFNNKNFSCSATAPLLTPVTAFASVQVEYAPVINCKQQKHVVEMEKAVSISCRVLANPLAEVTWNDGGHPLNSSDIKFNERDMTADEKEVSMNINKIGSHHLRSYTIHASNPLGNTTFTLNLSKKPGTRAQPLEPIADERTLAAAEGSATGQTNLAAPYKMLMIAAYFVFTTWILN